MLGNRYICQGAIAIVQQIIGLINRYNGALSYAGLTIRTLGILLLFHPFAYARFAEDVTTEADTRLARSAHAHQTHVVTELWTSL